MLRLNKDVLFLILKELQNDRKSLHSCLLVDRNWCETTVPILWKNPWKFDLSNSEKNIIFNVILLHLSEESRENLKNHKIDRFTETHQRPLFNYISFLKYLNFYYLENMIVFALISKSKISIITDEIMKLFNRCTKFTHLYYLSEFKFNKNILEELSRTSKSIENLEIYITHYNPGTIKLIKAQKKLKDVRFNCHYIVGNEPFYKALEESLIKHAGTIQCLRISWILVTKFLPNLINLISLDIKLAYNLDLNWSNLENVSLPSLRILKAQCVPYKSLASLIKNTKGHLAEISIHFSSANSQEIIIQSIYQNCQNLIYLKFTLIFSSSNLSEFEKLLINCQRLNGLVIDSYDLISPGWDDLFKILIKSSPTGLFKFEFCFCPGSTPKTESLKSFLDSWKGRHPMLLQTIPNSRLEECFDLIEKYKTEGIIKKYDNDFYGADFDQFEWHKKLID